MKKIIAILVVLIFVLPVVVFADEYVLVMSKNDNLCQYMLKLYNNDLKKYGQINYDKHKEFNAIKWEKQKSYFESYEVKRLIEHDTLISKTDIDNDGNPEIIIKDEHRSIRGIDADGLFIFREDDFNSFNNKVVIDQKFADKAIGAWGYVFNKKPFEGNVYRMQELPAFEIWTDPSQNKKNIKYYYSLGGWFYFHIFFYNGKYFTSMNDRLPDTAEKWRAPDYEENKWEIILNYTPEHQIKDTCYFLKICECADKKKGRK